jgi:cell division protein FtsZ
MPMSTELSTITNGAGRVLTVKVFGVGGAGGNALAQLAAGEFSGAEFIALNTDTQALDKCPVANKLQLGAQLTRGLGAGGDPEVGRTAAEGDLTQLQALCAGVDMVFILAGLGGGTGTGVAPVLARAAKENGALVLGVVTTPFDCEGARRQRQAQAGLTELKEVADGVICVPNQKILKQVDERTSLLETFRATNEVLCQGVRGVWRLLSQTGLINVDFADLCSVVRGRHTESFFATAESSGPNRARDVVESLMANPFLDAARTLPEAEAVLVSIVGDATLAMSEVSAVMDQINRQCESPHLIFGASIDETMTEKLGVTLIASRRNEAEAARRLGATSTAASEWDTQFLSAPMTRSSSRLKPPAPELSPEKTDQLIQRQAGMTERQRKKLLKMRQQQLPLEVVSKGRFEKSEPTLYGGEDLDVPTYIRRGVVLNLPQN